MLSHSLFMLLYFGCHTKNSQSYVTNSNQDFFNLTRKKKKGFSTLTKAHLKIPPKEVVVNFSIFHLFFLIFTNPYMHEWLITTLIAHKIRLAT